MEVVLEEIEGTVARLVPDDGDSPIHLSIDQLPVNYEIGAVYDFKFTEGEPHLTLLEDETKRRLKRIRSKRETLLNRSRKNK